MGILNVTFDEEVVAFPSYWIAQSLVAAVKHKATPYISSLHAQQLCSELPVMS